VGVVVSLLLAYAVFFGVSLGTGFDADDRLIGRALWAKMKVFLPMVDVGA
jgi:hypothetical protein